LYDIIVVGAGPAGASAARHAAQKGLKTLVLEREKIPRNKLCGGGVTPKVLKLLDYSIPKHLIECQTQSTRIHVKDESFSFEHGGPLVYMTSRSKFDSFLAEKSVEAGAELIDGTPAQRIAVSGEHVEVKTRQGSFRSRLVIGTDGMGSITANDSKLYDRWRPNQVAYAIESEIPVGERAVGDFAGSEGYFDIYFGVSPAGYGWVFPKDDHLTVGVGCRLSRLRDAQGLFNGFVKHVPELSGKHVPKPQAHLIPVGGPARVPTVSGRVMLAGDSAGFAEPLLGEGIYFAIQGAQLAAHIAVQACRQEKFDRHSLSRYETLWERSFGVDFDVAYRVACFTYLEQYDMERVARFFFKERSVQDCMVGLMEGSLRYRDVQSRILWPYLKYRLAKLGFRFYS